MKILAYLIVLSCCALHAYERPNISTTISKQALQVAKHSCPDIMTCMQSYEKCCRGPRGKRGHRGHAGATGATGPIGATGATGATGPSNLSDQIFINAPMMTNFEGDTPDTFFSGTYAPGTNVLQAWEMILGDSEIASTTVGTQFVIPDFLDRTQPVTLTFHCFVANQGGLEVGNGIVFTLNADYRATGEVLGSTVPATGYAETITSSTYHIAAEPIPQNLIYFTITVPLNPSLMIGKTWGDLVFTRAVDEESNYGASIFVTELSIQYTRVAS